MPDHRLPDPARPLLGLEQARLEQQLSALKSAYLDYEAFNRSVLYSIIDSEALLHFLRESDTAFRNDTLGLRLQQSIRSLSNTELSFVSPIVQPDGQPAYYFESSLSPFGSMDATQQRIVQQARQSASSATIYLEQADGAPLLVNTDFVLPASGSRPLPSQRGEAFAIQLAVRPERFIKLKRALSEEYGAPVEIADQQLPMDVGLSAEIPLSRSLHARLTPAPDYTAERLQSSGWPSRAVR